MFTHARIRRTMIALTAAAALLTIGLATSRIIAQQQLPPQQPGQQPEAQQPEQGQFPGQQPGAQQPQQQPRQQQFPGQQPGVEGQLRVGTFDPEAVFTQYPEGREFINQMQEFQQQAMQAQQAGDEQEFIRVQTEAQQAQQAAIGEFERALSQTLPEVAQEAGVDLIAVEITYSAPHIEVTDLTRDVTAKMQENAAEQPAQPEFPQPIVPELGR